MTVSLNKTNLLPKVFFSHGFITAIESKLRQSIKILFTIVIMNILCDKDIKRDEDTQNRRDPSYF